MEKTLKDLYRRGKIEAAGIYKAAEDGLITKEQAENIINPKGE